MLVIIVQLANQRAASSSSWLEYVNIIAAVALIKMMVICLCACIVKTLLIPKFIYVASVLCIPNEFVTKLKEMIYRFLWNGPDKVARAATRRVASQFFLVSPRDHFARVLSVLYLHFRK